MVQIITKIGDKIFESLNFGAHKNSFHFQLFVCLLNIILSAYPLLCYLAYSSDSHVIFWVGNAPGIVNLGIPVILLTLNIGVNFFSCTTMKPGNTQMACFLLFFILGAVLVGAGVYVQVISNEASGDLMHRCGQTPMTARVELEWTKLNQFAQKCAERQKEWPEFITKCPGYAKTFPNRVYPNYIEDLEYDFECTGFCRFWAKPLFNIEADRGTRCATALADKIAVSGEACSFPTIFLGIVLMATGACLAGYDNL